MIPTYKLRFVNRVYVVKAPHQTEFVETPAIFYPIEKKEVRILQQWWEADIANRYTAALAGDPGGEWRDIPLEKDQA